MRKTYRIYLTGILLLSTTGCDQLTKNVAQTELSSSAPISLINNFIRLEYAENPGAFLSIGEHLPSPVVFLLSSLMISVLLLLLIRLITKKGDVKSTVLIGLSLIAGGSLGNIIDRAMHNGVVVDFISIGIGHLRSGIFNVADIAILLGEIALVAVLLKSSSSFETKPAIPGKR